MGNDFGSSSVRMPGVNQYPSVDGKRNNASQLLKPTPPEFGGKKINSLPLPIVPPTFPSINQGNIDKLWEAYQRFAE